MFAPNTFLIGAQKSGTTYLASLLDQSPDICVCDPKEPQFFSKHFETGAAIYAKSFARPDAPVTIDASTTYTFLRPFRDMDVPDAPGLMAPVPERIRDASPEARLIYIMRDPVDRAVSALRHHARLKSAQDGPQSLIQAFQADPMLELVGRYADQIDRYLEVFPRERFLFLRFRDLISDPASAVRRCCDFLGVPSDPVLAAGLSGETHGAHSLSPLGRALETMPSVKQRLRSALPDPVRRTLAERLLRRPAPPVDFQDRAHAAERFAADRARVRDLTGLEI